VETPQKRKRDAADVDDKTPKKPKAADPKEGEVKQPSSKSTASSVRPKDSKATTAAKASTSVPDHNVLDEDETVTLVVPYSGRTLTVKRRVSTATWRSGHGRYGANSSTAATSRVFSISRPN